MKFYSNFKFKYIVILYKQLLKISESGVFEILSRYKTLSTDKGIEERFLTIFTQNW